MKNAASVALSVAVASVLVATGCPNKDKQASITEMNAGIAALTKKQVDTARSFLEKAVAADRDNHAAHYYLGHVHIQRNNWTDASIAFEKAVQVKPDEPMYQLHLGVARYQGKLEGAREAAAKAQGKKPQEVEIDETQLDYDQALSALDAAVKKNPDLWRAHYNIGLIHRSKEDAGKAAEAFTKAIQANPYEANPYVALAGLYRRWDYPDQAIQVATIGAQHVPSATEKSDVWFVLGMGYNDKRQDDKAIDAFNKALDARKDNHKVKFQRGQAYFRSGDYDKAKPDLEQFAKSGGVSAAFEKAQANRMIQEIAAKQR